MSARRGHRDTQERLDTHHRLGLPAYKWFAARLAAASGDYDEAIEVFSFLAETRAPTSVPVFQRPPAQGAILVAQAVLQNTLLGPHLSGDAVLLMAQRRLPLEQCDPCGCWRRPRWAPTSIPVCSSTRQPPLFAQAVLQDTARFVGPQLPADLLNPLIGHGFLRDYPIVRDGNTEMMAGAVLQTSSVAQSYRNKTAQLEIMPGWLALEAGRNVEAERLLQRVLFRRFLLQRGVARVVAPPSLSWPPPTRRRCR